MKVKNIRFSDAQHELVKGAAKRNGETFSEYVRQGAMLRALWDMARSGEPFVEDYEEVGRMIVEQARERGLI